MDGHSQVLVRPSYPYHVREAKGQLVTLSLGEIPNLLHLELVSTLS